MFKAISRIALNILIMIFMMICLIFHGLIIYGISQGNGELHLVTKARPVADVIKDNTFPDSLKRKLLLINDIKQFAFDSLGISKSDNYSTVYDQKNKPVLWTISAAEPYAMKSKDWTFPFLGSVSYKGFFNKKALQKEFLELVEAGYDIDVYSPSGWSTLGWFKDPILTGMLKKDAGSLSNLILHELTHGTLYVKNNVTFNENLANFIGDKGAELFLIHKFGKESKEYLDYENYKEDEDAYNKYILASIKKLEGLYASISSESEDLKKVKKKNLITEIVMGVNKLSLHKKQMFFRFTLQAYREGNAFFMSFRRYDSEYGKFEKEYKKFYNSNLKLYLKAMKEKYPSL